MSIPIRMASTTSTSIPAGNEFTLPLAAFMLPPGTIVHWTFDVEPDGTDIGFSIVDSSGAEIFPMDFFEGHSEGDIEIGEPQQDLELVWSNGHSWLTSKQLQYDIEIRKKKFEKKM